MKFFDSATVEAHIRQDDRVKLIWHAAKSGYILVFIQLSKVRYQSWKLTRGIGTGLSWT